MKKRTVALVLAIVLVFAVAVGGTVAYLTSTANVKNTFTVGSVNIKLDEAKVTPDGKAVTPAERVTANDYKLMPGHVYTKDPTVTVLNGSEESYVRMKVTFNNAAAIIAMCTDPEYVGEVTGVENAFPLIRMVNFVEANAAKWDGIIPNNMVETEEMLGNSKYFVMDKEADTLTYYFYYNETVSAPNADNALAVLFDSIKVPEWVTADQLNALNDFQINVVAEAIQADGFDDVDAAWAAFNA